MKDLSLMQCGIEMKECLLSDSVITVPSKQRKASLASEGGWVPQEADISKFNRREKAESASSAEDA